MIQNKNTFVLGLGFQKCGTSWVANYFDHTDMFFPGLGKEYHVWDYNFLPNNFLKQNILKLLGASSFSYNKLSVINKMRVCPDFYFDYFASGYDSGYNFAYDITPSYSILAEEVIEKIIEGFSQRNINVKIIISLRDPIERIKSAVRFNLSRSNYKEGTSLYNKGLLDSLKNYYSTKHCIFRTDYKSVFERIGKISDENVYVCIYENMFKHEKIKLMSTFFELPYLPHLSKNIVNKTNFTRETIDKTKIDKVIFDFYQDTYRYCFDHFPETKLLWKSPNDF
jgi:hypothetical protein